MPSDDHQLISAFQSGEACAFDALYQRYAGRVLAFAIQLTGDVAEAEDLTQEVFIGAFKGLHRFRSQSGILTWLLSIAMRRWRDAQRHGRIQTVPYPDGTGRHAELPSVGTAERQIDAVAMQSAMDQLEEPLRLAFLLVVVQERTYREASEMLGCPLGTVKGRVAKALREVRDRLQVKEEENVPCLLP